MPAFGYSAVHQIRRDGLPHYSIPIELVAIKWWPAWLQMCSGSTQSIFRSFQSNDNTSRAIHAVRFTTPFPIERMCLGGVSSNCVPCSGRQSNVQCTTWIAWWRGIVGFLSGLEDSRKRRVFWSGLLLSILTTIQPCHLLLLPRKLKETPSMPRRCIRRPSSVTLK